MKQLLILLLTLFVSSNFFAQEKSWKSFNYKFSKLDIQKNLIPEYKLRKDWKCEFLARNSASLSQLKISSATGNDKLLIESDMKRNYKMPVLSPKEDSFMPIAKPDPSINYHMLIKGDERLAHSDK